MVSTGTPRTKTLSISLLKKFALLTIVFLFSAAIRAQSPSRFAVIGDYGSSGQPELDVSNLVNSWNPDFVITLGDNNYESGAEATIDINIGQYYHQFISPYAGSYGSGDTVNRFFPSLGNHDWVTAGAAPYLNYFTLPGNERYYDFVKGPVHFYVIDSDSHEPDGNSSSSPQALWLQSALASSSELWKIVYFHHPPFSSGTSHGSQTFMQWPFKQWGATTVMAGHEHNYERIYRNNLLYFVNGLGGKSLYSFGTPVTGSIVRYNANYGAMLVEASQDSINFKFINRVGSVIDNYTLYSSDVLPPAQVQLLQPVNGETSVLVPLLCRWQSTATATLYQFELSSSPDFVSLLQSDSAITDTIKNLPSLLPIATYYWRVRAKNSNGWGVYSDTFSFTTTHIPEKVTLLYPPDNAVGLPNPVLCRWMTAGDATAYQFDISVDSTFLSLVQSDSTITDTLYSPYGLDSLTLYYWRARAKNGTGWGEYSDTRKFKLSGAISISAIVKKGWNLISVPVATGNQQFSTLFPHAISLAWQWNNSYSSADTPVHGAGYWLKFDSTRTVVLAGTPSYVDTLDVTTGWNLIGSISKPVSVDSILSIPNGVINSAFFDYQDNYQKTDTLYPFRGYWIKTQSSGKLILK